LKVHKAAFGGAIAPQVRFGFQQSGQGVHMGPLHLDGLFGQLRVLGCDKGELQEARRNL
jgi:hypothetical protein